jgi:hypothetical protein
MMEHPVASLIKCTFNDGPVWYIRFYRGGKQKHIKALDSYQIAKEKLRRFDSAEARVKPIPCHPRRPWLRS